jgi:hypothetical protein
MNRRQFQAASEQARKRAVELGEAGDTAAISELISLCNHAGPTVRRAAASALGKLATDEAVRAAVPPLCKLARDTHPQVRQYALLALGKIGMLLKQKLYQQEGKKLISLYPADLPHLDRRLGDAMRSFVCGGRDEHCESSLTEGDT